MPTKDKTKRNAIQQRWRDKNREHVRESDRKRYVPKPRRKAMDPKVYSDRSWAKKLVIKYGITKDTYAKMLQDQDGRCAVCRRPERSIDPRSGKPTRLAVDHDHEWGEVRGLLCSSCNLAIGSFEDNVALLEKAIRYLKDYPLSEAEIRRNIELDL